ncbi:MAG TPA: tetratricopeptide repeat protein [Ktedonobacterales bacterium]
MARSDRRSPQQRTRKQAGGTRDRHELSPLTDEQQSALAALAAGTPALAKELHAAQSGGRDELTGALEPLDDQDLEVMLAYAAQLGTVRGPEARDAADVAQALGELAARREIAREARRSRLRLRSAGFPSSLTIPPGPPAIIATDGHELTPPLPPVTAPVTPLGRWRKQLVEALATRSRESGEVALVLAWQEGIDPDTVRGYSLALDFWRGGVSGYSASEPMSRRQFRREIADSLQMDGQRVPTVSLTWAGARRLLQEALEVNAWRGIEPHEDFQEHRALIGERLLAEPDGDDEAQAAIAEEEERFAREGDRRLIRNDLEAEESLANWLGAWCFGDYGLAWDLLSDDNPLRRESTREEYISLRRQWAKEADPGGLRLTLIREQQQRASALWVPGTAGRLTGGTGKDQEAFWSLVLRETPLAGQIDEMPLATLTSPETGRHWYWTAYTVARDTSSGLWLISKIRDEGAASQALTPEELQKRIKENRDSAEQTAQSLPENPRDPRAMEAVRSVTGALAAVLHYDDALILKLPLDESVYRNAIEDARTMNNHERAAALLERMLGRFADNARTRFELGAEQYLVAEQYAAQGEEEAATAWLDRAIATMSVVVEKDRTAEHLQGLAELQARRGRAREAEGNMREALKLDASRASLHADLASVLMARVSGEGLEEQEKLTEEQQEPLIRESLAELRQAAQLDATLPGIFTRMGAIYELQGQSEDARLSYEEALRRNPEDATAHYALGSLLLGRKEDAEALPHFEEAVRIEPLAISFRLGLATGLTAMQRTREATRELDLIDRLQPNLPQVRELRAILARQQRDKK